jgi:putative transposase
MEVLFTLLAERYEKKSVLLTSNLVPSQWDQIFKDPMMTMAAASQEVPMRQSRFTETQIVAILKEADAGRPVNEIWRHYGISSATYYKWKAKYGGLEASDVKRLKDLEHENSRLKRMYADLSLENLALKDVIAKKL